MNEAPGLLLTVGHKMGHKVAAEGFEGPALDPSARG